MLSLEGESEGGDEGEVLIGFLGLLVLLRGGLDAGGVLDWGCWFWLWL